MGVFVEFADGFRHLNRAIALTARHSGGSGFAWLEARR